MRRRYSGRARPWAVIEVTLGPDERDCTELIRAAYRSSGSGVVVLVLRDVSRQLADRVLDPMVHDRRRHLQGVLYADLEMGSKELLAAAADASVVVASTESFKTELRSHGIEPLDVRDAFRVLASASD